MENRVGRVRLEYRLRADPDGAQRLTLLGEVDIAVADELARALERLERVRTRAVLDLSELRFIDLCGLDAILAALRRARRTGWELEVDPRVSRSVERIIDLAGVGAIVWSSVHPYCVNGDQAPVNFKPFTSRWSMSSRREEP
jgi:anti-sigma B factor antagonist